MKYLKNKYIKSALFTLIVVLLSLLVTSTSIFKKLDNAIYDGMYEKQEANDYSDDIKIISIDEASIEKLGKYDEWNRNYYANVINNLIPYSPSVIALDVMFTGAASYTDELVNAITNAQNAGISIILGFKFDENNTFDLETQSFILNPIRPYEQIDNALNADSLAFISVEADSDSVVRRNSIMIDDGVNTYKSLPYRATEIYAEKNGLTLKEYKENKKYLINFSQKPDLFNDFQKISFVDVYENKTATLESSMLNGTILFVGSYASAVDDTYFTAIDNTTEMFGIEVHANIASSILNGNLVKETPKALQIVLNIVFVGIVAFFICFFKFLFSTIISVGSIIFWFLLSFILYKSGNIYYPFINTIIIVFIGYVAIVAFNYISEKIAKGTIVKTFKRYMAPQVVDTFVKNNNAEFSLDGQKRNVACLFVDIRGFTKMSSTLDASEVVEILDEYLGMCSEAVFENDGMVDKYVGDCCMALFNAPFNVDDYQLKAIKCGLKIQKEGSLICKKYSEKFSEKYNMEINIGLGVGVNYGDAVIGNIGSKKYRLDYTAIGDTINTASRYESNAKSGQLIIGDDTYELLKDKLIVEDNGYLTLKGKGEVHTYNVIGLEVEKDEATKDSEL